MFYLFLTFAFVFWDKISLLYRSDCPGAHCVDQTNLDVIEIHLLLPFGY